MAFCEFSSEKIINNDTKLNNSFITDYMINATELQLKFYLYGLYLCQNPNIPDNSIELFCEKFGLQDKNDVLAIFSYWEDLGLVKIINVGDDYKLKYVQINKHTHIETEIKKGKYSKFCSTLQELITDRQILPNEYYEYIDFLEYSHMEQNAFLLIVNYATTLKGFNVGYKYILAIAKSWYYKNVLTEKAVKEEIEKCETYDENMVLVFKELSKTKHITFEDKEMWETITKKWNFDFNFIINTAKNLKGKKKASFNMLYDKLEKYYKLNIHTTQEALDYESASDLYKQTAINVLQQLGLYYETIAPIIDNYIVKWFNYGYDKETLECVAKYCFKNNIRTLEEMDKVIDKFVKLGLVSINAINDHINETIIIDKNIQSILEKLSLNRKVNYYDREMYKIWMQKYNFNDDVFDYAISKAIGKFQPMQYLNKILANFYENKVTTIEGAKGINTEFASPKGVSASNMFNDKKNKDVVITHNYTQEELKSFFTNLDDILK